MANQKTEREAREEILSLVANYCETYQQPKPYEPGGRIPYASRVFDAEEMTALVDSSLDFWLTAGRYADQFERDFASFLGVKFACLVNSGSSANLLAFMALTSPLLKERRILPGDEVITVAAGFPTTVAPMIQYGAVPVFVDVTIPQYNLDVNQLEAALSPRRARSWRRIRLAIRLTSASSRRFAKNTISGSLRTIATRSVRAIRSTAWSATPAPSATSAPPASTRRTI